MHALFHRALTLMMGVLTANRRTLLSPSLGVPLLSIKRLSADEADMEGSDPT